MHHHRRKGWLIKDSLVTPEKDYLTRRQFGALSASGIAMAGVGLSGAASAADSDPTADLYPAKKIEKFVPGPKRSITSEDIASTYNNFYEFGTDKKISRRAQALKIRPWEVVIDGEVNNPMTIEFDKLVRMMPIEERVYRLRCVEAWSMVIPWSGFALRHLIQRVNPTSRAKYVRFETFVDKSVAPGQRSPWSKFPYVEGITMTEARNDLTFMVTGVYGKPAAKQFGAPMRLMLPWKFGFKSAKSLVRITFQENRPVSFWEKAQSSEYGFWANVNPEYPHPRWSQASERVVGTGERIPTLKWNGYGEYVAKMYSPIPETRRLFF